MLTGMPLSISLGLTVLMFLFTMTEVPIESVGLKLFSGLDNFGIMAIPFFILAGTFLTRVGVARRMIAFTTFSGRPTAGWARACGRRGLRDVCGNLGLERGNSGCDQLDHDSGHGGLWLSAPLRGRRDRHFGRARHSGAAVDHPRAVRRFYQQLDQPAVHGGHRARYHPRFDARQRGQALSSSSRRFSTVFGACS